MHGLVRAIVRVKNRTQVARAVEAARLDGISVPPSMWLCGIWSESKSVVERHATEGRYGELLACRLESQYLKAENYRSRPKERKVTP
jgi:hypothetical protein